jgi:hypothetical protein
MLNLTDSSIVPVVSDSYYCPKFISDPDLILDRIIKEVTFLPRDELTVKIFDQTFSLPRDKQFYGDIYSDNGRRTVPLFRYTGNYIARILEWTPTLRGIRESIRDRLNQDCNHLVVNRYLDGSDYISYHHDKIRDFVPN